jgi:enamine deaminase RidA (YjgF/YER057c/UK114 family)
MRIFAVVAAALLSIAPSGYLHAAPEIVRASAGSFPISSVVVVKGVGGVDIAYASGVPGDAKLIGTEAQTADSLTKLLGALKAQGFGPGDIVMMRVYLVGDPTMGGHMDFKGMMASFSKVFGTAEQPNKPSRTTVQVAALGQPTTLVEIEAQAVKPAAKP